MLLYLDANSFNHPFDDQHQPRIHDETDAVLQILQRVVEGDDALVWSSALTFELSAHPEPESRLQLLGWANHCRANLTSSDALHRRAEQLEAGGLKALDAAHVAFAETGHCSAFLTCDDRLMRRASQLRLSLRVLNPVAYMREVFDAGNADG